tara:strand:- start:518 stop:826 length:309 start_codon:yes stop_codon:yes gene_type:complete
VLTPPFTHLNTGGQTLANHKSAAKRARQEIRRTARNSNTKSAVRTAEKKLRLALKENKADEAKTLLVAYTSSMGKAAQKGIYHAKTAARKISRLASQVHATK